MQHPAPPRPQQKNTGAIALVIALVIVVALVFGGGALAALGIYGARKYLAAAKTAEAVDTVSVIAKDAVAAYERESFTSSVRSRGSTVIQQRLCPSASRPVPASLALVRGRKYRSSAMDWNADEATNAGFYCLKFELSDPQYYQYDYGTVGDGTHPGDSFTASAVGDLDDDGKTSSFTLTGSVSGGLVTLGTLRQTDPDE